MKERRWRLFCAALIALLPFACSDDEKQVVPPTATPITGTQGTEGIEAAAVSATPNPVNFGTVANNSTTTKLMKVSNSGTSGTVTINSVTLASTGSAFFKLNVYTCTSGKVLSAGQYCQVKVTFAPTQTGSFSRYIYVKSNLPTLSVQAKGTSSSSTGGGWSASPSSVNMQDGQQVTVTFTNNGSANYVTSIKMHNGLGQLTEYKADTCTGKTIASGGKCYAYLDCCAGCEGVDITDGVLVVDSQTPNFGVKATCQ